MLPISRSMAQPPDAAAQECPPPPQAKAGAAAEKPEEPLTAAEIDIDVAIKKVASITSVTAELVEDVYMLNQKFSIKGSYRKGPNNLVYLRLGVAGLTDSVATSLQVCDGETLWDYQVVLDNRMYRKLTSSRSSSGSTLPI